MGPTTVSASEAVRRFGDLLARVRYRGESFLIRRGRTVVAQLGPPAGPVTGKTLAQWWERRPRLGAKEAEAFARDLAAIRAGVGPMPSDPWGR